MDSANSIQVLLAEAERLRATVPETAAFLDAVVQAVSARELGEAMPGPMDQRSAKTLADELVKQAAVGRVETARILYRALLVATSRRVAAGEFENKSIDEFRTHLSVLSKQALEAFHQQVAADLHALKQARLQSKTIQSSPGFKMSEPKLIAVNQLCKELGSTVTYSAGGGEAQ